MLVIPAPAAQARDISNCFGDSRPPPGSVVSFFAWKGVDSAAPRKVGIEASFPQAGGETQLSFCTSLGFFNLSSAAIWDDVEAANNNGGQLLQVGLFVGQGFGCDFGTPCDSKIHKFWTWGNCLGINCGGPKAEGLKPSTRAFGMARPAPSVSPHSYQAA